MPKPNRFSKIQALSRLGLGVALAALVLTGPEAVRAEQHATAPAAAPADTSEPLPLPIALPPQAVTPAPAPAPAPAQAQAAPAETGAEAPASDFATAGEQADNAQKYCTNIADAAADARYSRQAAAIAELEKEIEERIKALEAKRAEYEDWLVRREDFLRKADESVVAIFTQMRPDAASQQMSVMDMAAAAAILVKLNPRIASAILNEMDPTKAAQLTTTMAGLAKPSDEAKTPG